tara:strand:+ start:410 stop:973 length:564 start_codon:yes stop_codon:yes gene_type:complete
MQNIFFDRNSLKHCGENVIIGATARIRYPELVEIGDNVIIDDFTYISTSLKIHSFVHISAGCHLIGGKKSLITFKDFSTLSPNVVLAAGSDDYSSGIATPLVPKEYKGQAVYGEILINSHTIVGANSTVLPNVLFSEGSVLGAQSLLNVNPDPWSIYAGIPAKRIKSRKKEEIKLLEEKFMKELKDE